MANKSGQVTQAGSYYSKVDKQMHHTHTRRLGTSGVVRKCQATEYYCILSVATTIIGKRIRSGDCGVKTGPWCLGWLQKLGQLLWETVWQTLCKLNIEV